MTEQIATKDVEVLAADIGENIYMDVAKWHLYLRETHLHDALAAQFCTLLEAGLLNQAQVSQVLSDVSVSLGGGQREVPLTDLLPQQCQKELMEILANFREHLTASGYSF